jgi:hypothetical protein
MEKLLIVGTIMKSVLIVETIGLIVILTAILLFLLEIP